MTKAFGDKVEMSPRGQCVDKAMSVQQAHKRVVSYRSNA